MKRNIKVNSGLLIIILVLILSVSIIGYLGYRLYNNSRNDNDIVYDPSYDNEKLSYIELLDSIYPIYYDIHNGFLDLGYYYHNSSYRKVEDMDDRLKIYLAVQNIVFGRDTNSYLQYFNNNQYIVPLNIFKNVYKKMFGFDELNIDSINNLSSECLFYKLSDDKNYVIINDSCGDAANPNFLNGFLKFEKSNDNKELYLYEVVGYTNPVGEVGPNNGELLELYADQNKTDMVAHRFELNYSIILDYQDELPHYKYTFKYNDNGDGLTDFNDYYFYSVEKVK